MKKLTAGFCAIALAAVPTAQAMAAPEYRNIWPEGSSSGRGNT